jgi:hypothetical protein
MGVIVMYRMILSAEHDRFVYNRAMKQFNDVVLTCKMFFCPGAYHEILHESETVRNAAMKMIVDFFTQPTDDVNQVEPAYPFVLQNKQESMYSWLEFSVRAGGIVVASAGMIAGLALLVGGSRLVRGLRKIDLSH